MNPCRRVIRLAQKRGQRESFASRETEPYQGPPPLAMLPPTSKINFSWVWLFSLLTGALAAPSENLGGFEVQVGKTVEVSRSHSFCWTPTIHQFHSGEIMVAMMLSPDGAGMEMSASGYCLSRDRGLTWGRRYTMGNEADQDGAWSETADEDDRIWHFGCYPEQVRTGDFRNFYSNLTKFGHGGRTWSEDQDISFSISQPMHFTPAAMLDYYFDGKVPVPNSQVQSQPDGFTWGNILRGPQGEWLCLAYYQADDARTQPPQDGNHTVGRTRCYRVELLRSTDGGKTWPVYSTVAEVPASGRPAWMGNEGPSEGTLAFLPDHRLYAVYRTGYLNGAQVGNSWSADAGKTWTAPAPMGFTGVAPRLHRLSNGVLALITGRPGPVALRFNADGLGEHWSPPLELFKEMSSRYSDFAEISPGQLLVVYDSIPYGWKPIPMPDRDTRNTIYGTFIDVRKK